MKYIKQYDLPSYPSVTAQPGRRTIVGLEQGDTHSRTFRGFHKWMGGCGIGMIPAPCSERTALKKLHEDVRDRLALKVEEALSRAAWEQRLLSRWVADPEQFAVKPEEE